VRLKTLVDNLLANDAVSSILIRPHPKNLWVQLDSWIAARDDVRLRQSYEPVALDDMKGLQVVFGGNSSVLIESVTAGIPSGYIENLDYGSPDLHGFVAAGLIYRSEVNPNLNEMVRFYMRPKWQKVFRRFANIDKDESTVLAETVDAINNLRPTTSLKSPVD
jgi:hypothetical protein